AFNARQVSPTISDYENGNVEAALGPLSTFCIVYVLEFTFPLAPPDLSYFELPLDEFFFYEEDNVLEEDENLEVEGETPIDENDSDYDPEEVPVRTFDDFSIFDVFSHKLVPLGQLTEIGHQKGEYVAVGRVRSYSDGDRPDIDSEDTLDAGERVKLSQILELNTHHYSDSHKSFDRSLADPDLTHNEFLHALPNFQDDMAGDGFLTVDDVLERSLAAEDVESDETTTYLRATLPVILSEFGLSRLKRVPLIANVLEMFTPVVTPTVKDIAENLFNRRLQPAGDSLAQFTLAGLKVIQRLETIQQRLKTIQAHHKEDPKSMVWGSKPEGVQELIYKYVELDGVQYHTGDTVMVHYDEDSYKDYSRASNYDYASAATHSVNSYANRVWYV
ncbi:hypothetical protein K435DRAFT_880934, partial [Dendrothele bispora CBS 962.96]